MSRQIDDAGHLRHLLSLDGLEREMVEELLERAESYQRDDGRCQHTTELLNRTLANVFFEPSTRTRVSMEMAALHLGMDVVNLDIERSSRSKGESALDTLRTLTAMDVDLLAIRHAEDGFLAEVAKELGDEAVIVNCGEGHSGHPTQGLLDLLTVRQTKGGPEGLAIAIVGDIAHSRVARSAYQAFTIAGCEDVRIAGPDAWMPEEDEFPRAYRHEELDGAIRGADVVMMLRVQRERLAQGPEPDLDAYAADWQLTPQRMTLADDEAIVMHPGPMNRGVEIHDEVAEGPASVIWKQVANGLAVRMAVMAKLMERYHRGGKG